MVKILDEANQDPKKVKVNSNMVINQNTGIVARLATLRTTARNQGRRLGTTLQT
jgi:hypothetical protein